MHELIQHQSEFPNLF